MDCNTPSSFCQSLHLLHVSNLFTSKNQSTSSDYYNIWAELKQWQLTEYERNTFTNLVNEWKLGSAEMLTGLLSFYS